MLSIHLDDMESEGCGFLINIHRESIMWAEEDLAGKTIIGIKVKSPTVWLQFDGGWIQIDVSGDCCSEAFIDAVQLNGTPTLNGSTDEMQFEAQPTSQECDQLTAVRFNGDGGNVCILHRNSSNGYYGNWVSIHCRGEPTEDAVDGKCWYREIVQS